MPVALELVLRGEDGRMSLALCTLSHSPLMGVNDPAAEVTAAVEEAFARARNFV